MNFKGVTMVWTCFALLTVILAGCTARQPVYRATVKLFVSTPANSSPVPPEAEFYETQKKILCSQIILSRVGRRLKKTPAEVQKALTNLQVSHPNGIDIIVISVDSPSAEFAKDFANVLADEYLKYYGELQKPAPPLQKMADEVARLHTELKSTDEKLAAYATNQPELKVLLDEQIHLRTSYYVSLANLVMTENNARSKQRDVSVLEWAIIER